MTALLTYIDYATMFAFALFLTGGCLALGVMIFAVARTFVIEPLISRMERRVPAPNDPLQPPSSTLDMD